MANESEYQESTETRGSAPPNVVLIVADDLGWADVGYHNDAIQTDNIDEFVTEGIELDRFYAAPICTPTRCGLMTGRSPIRYGRMRSVLPPWRDMGLPAEEQTLASALSDAGYSRRACLGKWHLGHADPMYHPLNRGFTHFHGLYNGAFDYFTHTREGELDWHENFDASYEGGYATDLLSDHAVDFIHDTDHEPFFLYLPYNAPHTPNHVPPVELERYADSDLSGNRRLHAAMVSRMDTGIGRVLEALDQTEIAEDTVVLILSDNGGALTAGSSNDPLRNGKQTTFEGGIRVPGAIRWPNGLEGGRTVSVPVAYTDIFTTILRMSGVTDYAPPGEKPLDGLDMLDVIRGEDASPDRNIPFYWGQDGERERLALVGNRWKLVYHNGPAVLDAELGDDELFLFDLNNDPHEKHDVLNEHRDLVTQLLSQMKDFRRLRPDEDAVPPYSHGNEGFTPPEEWDMEEWTHDVTTEQESDTDAL